MYHFDVHRRDASRNSSSDGRTSHQDCTAVVELWALGKAYGSHTGESCVSARILCSPEGRYGTLALRRPSRTRYY